MGFRLSRIYTRTGDKGSTGLGDGTRVGKDSPRVTAYGDIDELNSLLGILLTYELPDEISSPLVEIQHDLFDLGGELSIPGHRILSIRRVEYVEKVLDELNENLRPLEEFLLPGGERSAAFCHLARTVCRRAERNLVRLARDEGVADEAIAYVNRLSDLLFVIARYLNLEADTQDVLWDRSRYPG